MGEVLKRNHSQSFKASSTIYNLLMILFFSPANREEKLLNKSINQHSKILQESLQTHLPKIVYVVVAITFAKLVLNSKIKNAMKAAKRKKSIN
jgi:hypothetical protein